MGRETKGRRGKGVTTVSDLPLDESGLLDLAAKLKQRLGTGGTIKDGRIEIQGDQRDRIVAELEGLGYRVKRAGGNRTPWVSKTICEQDMKNTILPIILPFVLSVAPGRPSRISLHRRRRCLIIFLGPKSKSTVVTGSRFLGGLKLENQGKGKVEAGLNIDE